MGKNKHFQKLAKYYSLYAAVENYLTYKKKFQIVIVEYLFFYNIDNNYFRRRSSNQKEILQKKTDFLAYFFNMAWRAVGQKQKNHLGSKTIRLFQNSWI